MQRKTIATTLCLAAGFVLVGCSATPSQSLAPTATPVSAEAPSLVAGDSLGQTLFQTDVLAHLGYEDSDIQFANVDLFGEQ